MKITPSQLTIAQLFGSKNEQYFIPAYQRRYAWKDKQLVELFEDINLLDKNDSHFFGSILLLTEPHQASINRLEVVDGQQRIISLSLLLEAIKDRFVELSEDDIVDEIEGYLHCKGLERQKQSKIVLGDLDEPDYAKVLALLNEHDIETESEIKNKHLLGAYIFFKKKITEFDFKQLNEYYFKLINNSIVIRLDTEKARDAYKLFETINNRGLSLRPTDIIKNFLLGHASLVGDDVLVEVRELWKDLIVSLDGIETDDFFRQYLMGILHRKITYSKLIYEFKKYYLTTVTEAKILPEYQLYNEFSEEEITDDLGDNENEEKTVSKQKMVAGNTPKISIIKLAKKLKNFGVLYARIINKTFEDKKINQHLLNLERIQSRPAYTFILCLAQKTRNPKEIVEVIWQVEIFMLRRHICEYRTSELDDIFSKMANIKGANIVEFVKKSLSEHFPNDTEFEDKFCTHIYKKEQERAKYILEQFEYDLISDQGEYTLNDGKEVHLEHIIPQTIITKKALKEYGDWVTYLGKDALQKHKRYVDRIGNYTLLGQKLNIKASNNPFRAKKKEYKKSNIQLTKQIVDEFSRFRFKQVEERSSAFAKKAVKLWGV